MMATAKGALPIGFDPLASDDSSPSPLAQVMTAAMPNRDDENLAFAAGSMAPSSNGTSGALSNAYKAQLDTRLDKQKLMAQYVPLIQESMVQQYRNNMLGQMMQAIQQRQAIDAMMQMHGGQPAQGQAPGQPPAPGMGMPSSGMPGAGGAPSSGFIGNMTPDEVAMLQQFGGVDFSPMWQKVHEGFKHEAGSWVDMPGQGLVYFPKVSENMVPDGKGGFHLATGTAEEQGRAAGITTSAQEAAKDPYGKPETVETPSGPRLMTPAQQRAMANGNAGPQPTAGAAPANNPGNLRPPGASAGFQQFTSPEQGLAALDKQLSLYGGRGLNTVNSIIGTYAPSNENDTASYIKDVSSRMGVKPDQPLNLADPIQRQVLMSAIMLHEQGPSKIFSQPQTPGAALATPGQKKVQEAQGDAAVNAAKIAENTKPLLAAIDQALAINDKVPYGPWGTADLQRHLSNLPVVGSGEAAKYAGMWDQLMGQNIMNGIASSGLGRMDIPIVNAIKAANGVPMENHPTARAEMLKTLREQVVNHAAAAQNAVASLNKPGITTDTTQVPMQGPANNLPKTTPIALSPDAISAELKRRAGAGQ